MPRFTHDHYAGLNHVIGDRVERHHEMPTWLSLRDLRRLDAYRALAGYLDNVHRYWLPHAMWQGRAQINADTSRIETEGSPAGSYREYGHAATLVQTARTLALGNDQQLVTVDDETSEQAKWLAGWAERTRWRTKLLEAEDNAAGLGDGVLAVVWNARMRQPVLRSYDPGFFFPDWSSLDAREYEGWDDEEFPPVVHLCWTEDDEDGTSYLRKTTYRMVELDVARDLPWSDVPSRWTCRMTQHRWPVDRLPQTATVYDLPDRPAYEVREPTDLGVDFLPVIHLTNDVAGSRLWGRSTLLRVVQIVDDLAVEDTDLAVTAQLVASPPTVTQSPTGAPALQAGPGAQWNMGMDGTAQLLDTSRSLDALLKQADRLEDLLASRSRVAQVLLGSVGPDDVPSGYAMELGFAPTRSLIDEMRLARSGKHALIGKFAIRTAQANRECPVGPTPKVRVRLGDALPVDQDAVVKRVAELLNAHAVSTETAVLLLQRAGVHEAEATDEVRRITEQNLAAAVALVDATGDVDAARRRLGLDGVPAPVQLPTDDDDDVDVPDVVPTAE